MIQAIIFDMDGVVVDSEPTHRICAAEIVKKYGIDFPPDEFKQYTGMAVLEVFQHIKDEHHANFDPKVVKKEWEEQVVKHMKKHTPPTPGIQEFIEKLKPHYRLALASSSTHELIKLKLGSLNLLDQFETLTGAENISKGKPDPELFLKSAQSLHINPSNCIVIEDATHGVMAAKAAGMKCIGYANPNSIGQDLSRADKIISDFAEIDVSEFH